MFDIRQFLSAEIIGSAVRAITLLVVGIPLIFFLARYVRTYMTKKYSAQHGMIAGKVLLYVGITVVLFSELNELGFKLTHLVAAAGVIGIAVGFASQTSVSNIISGFFLIVEQPFVVGDVISIAGGTTGEVLSIDMLSIKLRTFENKFVRIPNESILKSEVTNVTHFPIRRVDITVAVAYKEEIGRVRNVLLDIANRNALCLQEPEPQVRFKGFGSSSVDLLFVVWAEKSDYLSLKTSIQEDIKRRFDEAGIEIPFPHLSLYRGAATEPFPVQLVGNAEKLS